VAVVGGGPAGAFFGCFILDAAKQAGLDIAVDIFEPRDFHLSGPAGCNMCGGILSEPLVDHLATEGIELPANVVQRAIDSYVLHTDVGSVRIKSPLCTSRIGVVHRGAGPRGIKEIKWGSLDSHLFELAQSKGATGIRDKIVEFGWDGERPRVRSRDGVTRDYDLLVVAVGVNSTALKLLPRLEPGYNPPHVSRTVTREYYLGAEQVGRSLGDAMHIFLLNIARLEFAAIIPKGDYATVCLLGDDIDDALMRTFLDRPEVRGIMPSGWQPEDISCHCQPHINVRAAIQPFTDRVVFIGDCATSRLYKDGIGAAYSTAKAAATTAVFHGISANAFRRHYWPTCRAMAHDNRFGKLSFAITGMIQKHRFMRRALVRMAAMEQGLEHHPGRVSVMLWDMFTGSAPYRKIFFRGLHPAFLARFAWSMMHRRPSQAGEDAIPAVSRV
jgi:flavin-dependent dehydrogenase